MYDYPLSPSRTPGALRAIGACAGDRLRYGIGQAKVRHRRASVRVVYFQDRDANGQHDQVRRTKRGDNAPGQQSQREARTTTMRQTVIRAGPPMTISQGPHRGVFRATAKRGLPVPRHRPHHESQTDPHSPRRNAPSEEQGETDAQERHCRGQDSRRYAVCAARRHSRRRAAGPWRRRRRRATAPRPDAGAG